MKDMVVDRRKYIISVPYYAVVLFSPIIHEKFLIYLAKVAYTSEVAKNSHGYWALISR